MWHVRFAWRGRPAEPIDRRRRTSSSWRPTLEPLEQRRLLTALPSGFVETLVAGGLTNASAMEFAPDGRIFVTQQGGDLRIVKNGAALPTPFLSLNVDSSGERGLLGVTLDPNFAQNQFIYVYYTVPGSPAHNRVSRFTASGDIAQSGSETVLLELDDLSLANNHNGGGLHFGEDGKLYVAVGENNDGANSQTLGNLLGKILRIDSDGAIPSDNPFFNTATGNNRAIWALGLRNPFTFAVQPGTGRIFLNDVGAAAWEEINEGVAGGNYGWPIREGVANDPQYIDPLFAYAHGNGDTTGGAITGSAFYNPAASQFPSVYNGDYFFADLTSNWIRRYDPATDTATAFATGTASFPVDVDIDAAGSLYYLSRGAGGVIHKIQYAPTAGFGAAIRNYYADILGRTASGDEVDYWTSLVQAGMPLAQIASIFATSGEYRAGIVRQLYSQFLGRPAESVGVSHWVSIWNSQGAAAARAGILGSADAVSHAGGQNGWLQVMYQSLLGRTASSPELASWLEYLQSHSTYQTAQTFLASDEFRSGQLQGIYQSYLRRAADGGAVAFWLAQLRAGLDEAAVQVAILSSPEYLARS